MRVAALLVVLFISGFASATGDIALPQVDFPTTIPQPFANWTPPAQPHPYMVQEAYEAAAEQNYLFHFGDVNGNGRDDVVHIRNGNSTVFTLLDGGRMDKPIWNFTHENETSYSFGGDFDGDGVNDVVRIESGKSVSTDNGESVTITFTPFSGRTLEDMWSVTGVAVLENSYVTGDLLSDSEYHSKFSLPYLTKLWNEPGGALITYTFEHNSVYSPGLLTGYSYRNWSGHIVEALTADGTTKFTVGDGELQLVGFGDYTGD